MLVATNGYTGAATPWLRRRLVAIGSYVVATAPLPADRAAAILPKRRMAFDSRHFLHYFRVTADRRLLFGGRAEFSRPSPEATGAGGGDSPPRSVADLSRRSPASRSTTRGADTSR